MQFCTKVGHGKSWRHRTRLVLHGGCKMTFSSTGCWCGNPCPICKKRRSFTSLENNFCFWGMVGLKLKCFGAEHCEHAHIHFVSVFQWCCIRFKHYLNIDTIFQQRNKTPESIVRNLVSNPSRTRRCLITFNFQPRNYVAKSACL